MTDSEPMTISAIRILAMSVSSQPVHIVGEHHASHASCSTMRLSNRIQVLDGHRAPKQVTCVRLLMVYPGSMLQRSIAEKVTPFETSMWRSLTTHREDAMTKMLLGLAVA